MTLRLVLVSLVVGLGISLPGWPTLEGWVASSQKWMNARLAEWDDRQSEAQNYVVIHDLLKVEMERVRMARLTKRMANHQTSPVVAVPAAFGAPGLATVRTISLERSALAIRNAVALLPLPVEDRAIASDFGARAEVFSTARVEPPKPAPASFEPLEVGDRLYVGTAFELNHLNEGIGILPRVAVGPVAAPAPQPADLVALLVDRYRGTTIQVVRDLGRDLRAVAARELAAREAAVELAAREAAALEFEAMGSSENLYFADAPVAAVAEVPSFEEMENSDSLYFADAPVAAVAEVPSFEEMENSDSLYFADSLVVDSPEPVAEGAPVDSGAVEAIVAGDQLPDDPFAPAEPVATGDEQRGRTQQAGVTEPSKEVEKSIEPEVVAIRTVQNSGVRRPEVSRAVRLTRDALYAWVNVLTEPSLVAVGPSTTTNR